MYHVHGEAGDDPTEPERGPFPYEPIPHSPGMAGSVDSLRRMNLHPSALPLGLINPGQEGGCSAVQHLQFLPLPHSCKERRRDLWDQARGAQSLGGAVDQHHGLAVDHRRSGARVEAVEVERDGTVLGCVRRRSLSRAAQ